MTPTYTISVFGELRPSITKPEVSLIVNVGLVPSLIPPPSPPPLQGKTENISLSDYKWFLKVFRKSVMKRLYVQSKMAPM
jgi:hypothetical protein